MNYELKDVVVGGWTVKLVNDPDGQLSVYLSHQDGTEIHECGADISKLNESFKVIEWAERFTTDKIETEFEEDWQNFVENNSNFKST